MKKLTSAVDVVVWLRETARQGRVSGDIGYWSAAGREDAADELEILLEKGGDISDLTGDL